MIKVENLTKRYAGRPPIQDLNFEKPDEIMGFLGPNGRGKTTTISDFAATFMPPTSGSRSIAGLRHFEQSLQARALSRLHAGKHALYSDMRVTSTCVTDAP